MFILREELGVDGQALNGLCEILIGAGRVGGAEDGVAPGIGIVMTTVVVCEFLQRLAGHAMGLNVPRKARRRGGDRHVNWREFGHSLVGTMGARGGRSGVKKEEDGGERKRRQVAFSNLVDRPHPAASWYGSL